MPLIPTAGLGAQSVLYNGRSDEAAGSPQCFVEAFGNSSARVVHPAVSLLLQTFSEEVSAGKLQRGRDPGAIFSKVCHVCGTRAVVCRMEMPHPGHSLGVLKGIKIGRIQMALCVQSQFRTQWFTSWQCWDPALGCPLYLCPPPQPQRP